MIDDDKPSPPNRDDLAGFGDRLKWARWHRGIRQQDLSDLSGVHRITINALENNQRAPSIQSIIKLATALNVADSWLAFGVGDSNPPAGEPLYQPPEPYNKHNKVSPEKRAERREINKTAHRIAQANGTSFHAERQALRAQREEEASLLESRERYGMDDLI